MKIKASGVCLANAFTLCKAEGCVCNCYHELTINLCHSIREAHGLIPDGASRCTFDGEPILQ